MTPTKLLRRIIICGDITLYQTPPKCITHIKINGFIFQNPLPYLTFVPLKKKKQNVLPSPLTLETFEIGKKYGSNNLLKYFYLNFIF